MTFAAMYGAVATERAQKSFYVLKSWKNQKSGTWNKNTWPV